MYKKNHFEDTIKYFNSSLSIPIYYDLKIREIDFISSKIIQILKS